MTLALAPMQADQFSAYRAQIIADFAQENVEAGIWSKKEALEKSEEAISHFLPKGLETPNHYLYSVIAEAEPVGVLWFRADASAEAKTAFILDISIAPHFRGQGYGRQTMLLLEEQVRSMGVAQIGLNVFSHNEIAVRLYEKLDYQPVSVHMSKHLK